MCVTLDDDKNLDLYPFRCGWDERRWVILKVLDILFPVFEKDQECGMFIFWVLRKHSSEILQNIIPYLNFFFVINDISIKLVMQCGENRFWIHLVSFGTCRNLCSLTYLWKACDDETNYWTNIVFVHHWVTFVCLCFWASRAKAIHTRTRQNDFVFFSRP